MNAQAFGLPRNPTAEQIREDADVQELINAQAKVAALYAELLEVEGRLESRSGLNGIGDALARLDMAQGDLAAAAAECGYIPALKDLDTAGLEKAAAELDTATEDVAKAAEQSRALSAAAE